MNSDAIERLVKWLRYERIDGVPDEQRRRECADALLAMRAEIELLTWQRNTFQQQLNAELLKREG
jgi:hypothetical protein